MKKLILALTCLVLAIPCQAKIITVNWDGSGEYLTIQAAINDSNDGDTIIVADGTYTGFGNRDIDFLGKAIMLRSENGPENCIIDCNKTGRGFYFHSGEDHNSVVCGFTITNGYAEYGGGIYCRDSSPMLTNCTFRWNSTPTIDIHAPEDLEASGGAMFNYENSSPILINCTFSYNSTIGGGGIINYLGCNPMLTNCIFHDNLADVGGGIVNYLSSPTLTNCTFSNNDAIWGSGMVNLQISSPTLTNCILWDGGDEIQNYGSTITITYSDVQGGSTGVYVDPNSTLNWGVGNIDADPCFVDPNNSDYHLKSQAGRWEPSTKMWVQDDVTSPCIDAGNPGCPEANEPAPNGNRRNMGAYGGTAEASKSPANWRSIADLTNDWVVDSNDLKVFVGYWLQMGECIPSDLDRSQSVDFNDFAIFGLQWLYPSAFEPGMTFRIDECDLFSQAEQSSQARFSVTVDGLYIHFEDTMTANCCPDELGLEMTVEDNLITIYETEYTPGGCHCMCHYPVTATLGPFEPGIYTLEVYENYGGFIESTTVVIDPPE